MALKFRKRAPSSSGDPDVVYHYTSLDVLVKIIQSRQLWATNIGYLNDTSERSLYLNLAKERLPELVREEGNSAARLSFDSSAAGSLPYDENLMSLFVTSFTTEDDSLPQWRAYTPPGLGVQIGFKTDALKKARICHYEQSEKMEQNLVTSRFSFFPVAYISDDPQDGEDQMLIAEYRVHLERYLGEIDKGTYAGSLTTYLERRLGKSACRYKHVSFAHEKEYRLLVESFGATVPLHYRSAKTALVPYIKLNIPCSSGSFEEPWDAIDEIRLGPSPSIEQNYNAVLSLLLSRQGPHTFHLLRSRATFREL